jgi:pyruvate formate lyase activating enzyme
VSRGLLESPLRIRAIGRRRAEAALDAAVVPEAVAQERWSGVCFDIQRYSIHDGPGIRTTVFLKGCPLACPWCHNPESQALRPEIRVIESRCIHCGSCGPVCPQGLAGGPYPPDPERCLRCGLCAQACPTGTRQLVGRSYGVTDVLRAVERDRPFYDESGGGVTFSGGEPLAQWRFLLACLEAAQAQDLHTAVDTSGFASLVVIRAVAARTNLFLYDLKVLDPERHLRFVGVPLAPILRNLRALDAKGAHIWLRVPYVPGYTDDEENLAALGAFAAGLRHTRRLHLLPYHRLGADKYGRLGRPDRLGDVQAPSPAAVEAAATYLRSFGLDVRVGG